MNKAHSLTGSAGYRLLEALCAGPDSGMAVRELARGAGLSLSSLSRELEKFVSWGALRRTTRGNRVFHALDRRAPFVRLLMAACTVLGLSDVQFDAMPSDRETEAALARLCAHVPPDADIWRRFGDPGFLAGLAVALSCHSGFDRRAYLALADSLSRGAGATEAHEFWCRLYRPDFSRFFQLVDRERRTHARSENK